MNSTSVKDATMTTKPQLRAVIYARYSSDLQSQTSIEDQVRICERLARERGFVVVEVYSDHAISGASKFRPGFQALSDAIRLGEADLVVAESIDRISRDQEHLAHFFKILSFAGVPLVTVAEGEISELHVGLKGTMSALYLKDLAQKTRRGLEGRVRQGRSAGGISYGYDIVRTIGPDGLPVPGGRSINPSEAEIVRRIFGEFAAGRSPRAIAISLNKDSIKGPSGKPWGASTIYGNWRRGTGILNNELYVGRLVWNRQRFIKDPLSGKRQARLNPQSAWIIEAVPELRIIDEDLWRAVEARQGATRTEIKADSRVASERARRPRYLFSGILKCGQCGGAYTLVGKHHYGCADVRNRGTCDNRLTIRRDQLEEQVLSGLKEHLLSPDLIGVFVDEYRKEWNRLIREEEGRKAGKQAERSRIDRQIAHLIEAVKAGLFHASMNEELSRLEARKLELALSVTDDHPAPPRLHPALAATYRAKVANLTEALNDPTLKDEAAEAIRSLLQEIRLIPGDGGLVIELVGELAGILALGEESKRPPGGSGRARQSTLVAGA